MNVRRSIRFADDRAISAAPSLSSGFSKSRRSRTLSEIPCRYSETTRSAELTRIRARRVRCGVAATVLQGKCALAAAKAAKKA
jgi:hypothetical protein